eukprot:365503-Chlamydomonas_euryale.AAC.3
MVGRRASGPPWRNHSHSHQIPPFHPLLRRSATAAGHLMIRLVGDVLNEAAYLADVAGLHYHIVQQGVAESLLICQLPGLRQFKTASGYAAFRGQRLSFTHPYTHKRIALPCRALFCAPPFRGGPAGIEIRVEGFSHKLHLLCRRVFEALASGRFTEAAFEREREALLRKYRNTNTQVRTTLRVRTRKALAARVMEARGAGTRAQHRWRVRAQYPEASVRTASSGRAGKWRAHSMLRDAESGRRVRTQHAQGRGE